MCHSSSDRRERHLLDSVRKSVSKSPVQRREERRGRMATLLHMSVCQVCMYLMWAGDVSPSLYYTLLFTLYNTYQQLHHISHILLGLVPVSSHSAIWIVSTSAFPSLSPFLPSRLIFCIKATVLIHFRQSPHTRLECARAPAPAPVATAGQIISLARYSGSLKMECVICETEFASRDEV